MKKTQPNRQHLRQVQYLPPSSGRWFLGYEDWKMQSPSHNTNPFKWRSVYYLILLLLTLLSCQCLVFAEAAEPLVSAGTESSSFGQEIRIHKDLNGFPFFGVADKSADILYSGQKHEWTFQIPENSYPTQFHPQYGRVCLSMILDDYTAVSEAAYHSVIKINGEAVFDGFLMNLNVTHGNPTPNDLQRTITNWVQVSFPVFNLSGDTLTISIENDSELSDAEWIAVDYMELQLLSTSQSLHVSEGIETFVDTEKTILLKDLNTFPTYGALDHGCDVLYSAQGNEWTIDLSASGIDFQQADYEVALSLTLDDHFSIPASDYIVEIRINGTVLFSGPLSRLGPDHAIVDLATMNIENWESVLLPITDPGESVLRISLENKSDLINTHWIGIDAITVRPRTTDYYNLGGTAPIASEGMTESLEICDDGLDNDADGFTDCQDLDCFHFSRCSDDLTVIINQIDTQDCPMIQTFLTVSDNKGNPMDNLTAEHFTVGEDGTSQPIVSVLPDSGALSTLSVSLVLDNSGSMSGFLGDLESAVHQFIDNLSGYDAAEIIRFNETVTMAQEYTKDTDAIHAAVTGYADGGTNLYDALHQAITDTRRRNGRKAVIAMTDGCSGVYLHALDDVIGYAVKSGIPVFTIGFGGVDEAVLKSIAENTGGLYYHTPSADQLQTIYKEISKVLGNQYVLTYETSHTDDRNHDLQVMVNYEERFGAEDKGFHTCAPKGELKCASFDFFNNLIHIPSINIGMPFWMDLRMTDYQAAVRYRLDSFGVGKGVEDYAFFNVFDYSIHIPCIIIDGKSNWMDLRLVNDNPIEFELSGHGENAELPADTELPEETDAPSDQTDQTGQNDALHYFGFAVVDCGYDDPTDAMAQTNYVDEIKGFTNVAQMCVTSENDDLQSRLQRFQQAGIKAILNIDPVIFDHFTDETSPSGKRSVLRADANLRWSLFVLLNQAVLTPDYIAAFYIVDEPVWNGVSKEDMQKAVDILKDTHPDIPTMAVEASVVVDQFLAVEKLDWLGFNRYSTMNRSWIHHGHFSSR